MTAQPQDLLTDAAEQLFAHYAHLDAVDHEAAVAAFVDHHQPFYDQPRRRWLVSYYPLVRSVLRDPRLSNDLARARPHSNSDQLHARLSPDAPSLLFIDPPEHDQIKTELARLFSAEALHAFRDNLTASWQAALHRLAAGQRVVLGADVVHPICVTTTFGVLGLPIPAPADVAAIVEDLYQVNLLFDLNADQPQRQRSQRASIRMRTLVADLLPGTAVAERMRAGGANEQVTVSTVVFMLRAGVVTLGSLLMSMLAERLDQPGQPSDDSNQQLIRHTPTGDTGRVTVEATDLAGVPVPAGSTVIALISAGNQGLRTQGASPAGHLVFGAGAHRCVGERLVRMQLTAATAASDTLPRRFVTVATEPHRTPSFRGYREIVVKADGADPC